MSVNNLALTFNSNDFLFATYKFVRDMSTEQRTKFRAFFEEIEHHGATIHLVTKTGVIILLAANQAEAKNNFEQLAKFYSIQQKG